MIDILFLILLVYYVLSTIFFIVTSSYTAMKFIYSTSYWFFSKISVFFTRIANYFYTKIEEHESHESRYLFDSDDDMSEEDVRDLNEVSGSYNKADVQYDRYIFREFQNEQYPANFTSIYIDPPNLK